MRHPAVLLLSLALACQGPSLPSATETVDRFYAARIAAGTTGAPTHAELAGLTPYLGDSLRTLLEGARRLYQAESARSPGDKPAFAEGDLFSSLFEGPTSAVAVGVDSGGDRYRVTVRMRYDHATPPVAWEDRVVLGRNRGRFVIEDIEYGGDWPFASRGSLRTLLATALASQP